MDKQKLINYCGQGLSQRQIARLENCSQSKIGRWLRNYNIDKQLTLKKINYCIVCNNPLHKGKKYCSKKCQVQYQKNLFISNIKTGIEKLDGNSQHRVRKYLLYTRLHICEICSNNQWNNNPIPLIADHIDGNHINNNFDNLRLICPNCDALLPTYKGRNRGKGKFLRAKRYKENKSY